MHDKSATRKHLQMVDGQRLKMEAPPARKDARVVSSSSRPATLIRDLATLESGEESDDFPSSLIQLTANGESSSTLSGQPTLEDDLHPCKKAKSVPSGSLFLDSDSDIEISSPVPISVAMQEKLTTQGKALTSELPYLGTTLQKSEKVEAQTNGDGDDDDFADLLAWVAEGDDIEIVD